MCCMLRLPFWDRGSWVGTVKGNAQEIAIESGGCRDEPEKNKQGDRFGRSRYIVATRTTAEHTSRPWHRSFETSAYTGNKYDEMKTQRWKVPPLYEAESIASRCMCTLQMPQGAVRVSGSGRAAESVYYSANARWAPGSGQSRQSSKLKLMRPQHSFGLDFVATAPIDLLLSKSLMPMSTGSCRPCQLVA